MAPTPSGPIAQAVHTSFVHAIHIGMTVGVFVILIATVVSILFVRSHVGGQDGERAYGH